jgi:hypothetical protein
MKSLGSLKYRIISPAKRYNLTSFFPICILFLSLVLPVWLRIQALYWVRAEKVHAIVLFLTLEEMISVFPYLERYSLFIIVDLSYIAFIMLRLHYIVFLLYYVSSIPSFFRAFIMNGYWIFSVFFCIIEISCDFCPLFCSCSYYVYLLAMNHHCIPEMKATWSGYIIFVM